MFIIQSAKDKTIDWPVTVEVARDGGKIKKFEFTGTFKLLNDDEKEAILDAPETSSAIEGAEAGVNAWKERNVDSIMKIMTGWKGIVDENKVPIDCTRDNLRTISRGIDGVSVIRGLNTAIAEISTGSKAKN